MVVGDDDILRSICELQNTLAADRCSSMLIACIEDKQKKKTAVIIYFDTPYILYSYCIIVCVCVALIFLTTIIIIVVDNVLIGTCSMHTEKTAGRSIRPAG